MLILKANHIIDHDNIQHLLRSTLVKLNISKELLLTQSLVQVFAHLVYIDMNTTLVFLNSLPAPDGTRSALEFVLDKWLAIQRYFNGYENQASALALCKLFQLANKIHSPVGDVHINLHRIEVSCDDEFDTSNQNSYSVTTRSKSKEKDQKRTVPSTVKILKLLLNELRHIREKKESAALDNTNSASEEDEDDNDDDDFDGSLLTGQSFSKSDMFDLNQFLADEGEDDWQDPDEVLSEEIANIDLEDALKGVLHDFRVLPSVEQFVHHLTSSEAELLQSL